MNVLNSLNRLRFLPPVVHGLGDYPTAAALLAAPKLFGFGKKHKLASLVAQIAGGMVLGQAVTTDNKTGLIKKMPMRTHLMMDLLLGPMLAASPFLLGFGKRRWFKKGVWMPHVILGSAIALWALLTRPQSERGWEKEVPDVRVRERSMPSARRFDHNAPQPLSQAEAQAARRES